MYRVLFPQGGLEPPQSEPESEVLPLHNRGMQCENNIYNLFFFVKYLAWKYKNYFFPFIILKITRNTIRMTGKMLPAKSPA